MIRIEPQLCQQIVNFRRDLHRHPELSWQEHRTAARICGFLESLGIAYRSQVAKTGIIAEIPGRRPGPFVALRADMDALPIVEETGLGYASLREGVMHACGHDGHISMLLGAAAMLIREPNLVLPVRLLFQPAEELGEGAKAMIEHGALEDVAMIFGGHVDRHFSVGAIAVTEGAVNASTDSFTIRIHGRGGHAARPHETVDAVVVSSLMVMAIQTIVSREINPANPSVVTVGRLEAGTAGNVIAGQAVLRGSIRAQDQDVREHLQGAIDRIARSIGQLHGASVQVSIDDGTPPVINPPEGTRVAQRAAEMAVGQENVVRMETANMGGEDFAHYLDRVAGCYVRFGSRGSEAEGHPAHSSKFDIDEQALSVGAAFYYAVAKLAGQEVVAKAASQETEKTCCESDAPISQLHESNR